MLLEDIVNEIDERKKEFKVKCEKKTILFIISLPATLAPWDAARFAEAIPPLPPPITR